MRLHRVLAALSALVIALPATATGTATATAVATEHEADYVVMLNDASPEAVADSVEADPTHVYDRVGGFAATLDAAKVRALRADPAVAWVEEDSPVTPAFEQTPAPWNLDRIDAAAPALDSRYAPGGTGSGVDAYVIDTGVRADHVEFAGRVQPGYSSVADAVGTEDCHGHGTGVASVLAGEQLGAAKQASIIPVRVLDCSSNGTVSSLIDGLDWVADQARTSARPAIANLSVETAPSASFDAAVRSLIDAGVTTTVAAGNGNGDACSITPARLDAAITVGNSDRSDDRQRTSNFGPCVDLYAPGTQVQTAGISSPTAQVLNTGASFASPLVAGAAALALEQSPQLRPAQVKQLIIDHSTPDLLGNLPDGTPNRLLYVPERWETNQPAGSALPALSSLSSGSSLGSSS